MSFKQYVPDTSEDWGTYWSQTSISKELDIVKTDGLQPIFEKYLDKQGIHVEAGCGLGKWVIDLMRKGYKVVGLDTYIPGLFTLKDFDSDMLLMGSDVANMGLLTNSIDTYISLGVVEHFEEGPQKPLAEAYRALKPGGLALIEVPYDSPLRQISRLAYKFKVLVKSPARILVEGLGLRSKRQLPTMRFYEFRYRRDELEGFVKAAGFELIETLPKDDLDKQRSIMLWSDYVWLRHKDATLFKLNKLGQLIKFALDQLTPFSYSALIISVGRKPLN